MKQTLEEAANQNAEIEMKKVLNVRATAKRSFIAGAEWYAKQSPWISIEEQLPDKGQRVLVGFLYYYKYDDREAESRKHIDVSEPFCMRHTAVSY